MKTIIFVCHGNICRSVAAEFIAKDFLRKRGNLSDFNIVSRATSLEEIGNDIYPPMKRVLLEQGVNINQHYATRITLSDYQKADYIFYMDENNYYYLSRLFPDTDKKEHNICEFTQMPYHEIEDPWYTGEYLSVFHQISDCVEKLFDFIK